MARKVFFSFHYQPDCVRASQVRNIGVVEGNPSATDNDWETVARGGDPAIQRWLDNQLSGRTCTIVLIGKDTAGRKWINYEIEKSWNGNKGVLGIYIHNLKNFSGAQTTMGSNPFSGFNLKNGTVALSSVVKAYNPPFSDSKDVYKYISDNLESWIEEAIRIRNQN